MITESSRSLKPTSESKPSRSSRVKNQNIHIEEEEKSFGSQSVESGIDSKASSDRTPDVIPDLIQLKPLSSSPDSSPVFGSKSKLDK